MKYWLMKSEPSVFGIDDLARVTMVVEVRNLNNLEQILKAIGKVRGVESIDRFQLGGPSARSKED